MNVFDYLFEENKTTEKDFVLGTKETISFNKLFDESLKFASYLTNTVGENKNIILISQNSTFFLIAYLGILKSGNVCVPLNFAIEQDNFNYISKQTDCQTFIITKKLQSTLQINQTSTIIIENELDTILKQEYNHNYNTNFDKNRLAVFNFI